MTRGLRYPSLTRRHLLLGTTAIAASALAAACGQEPTGSTVASNASPTPATTRIVIVPTPLPPPTPGPLPSATPLVGRTLATTGTPTKPLVVFEGGSVPYGYGVADAENFPNQTIALLAPTMYDAVNLARASGTTLRALTASAPGDVDLLYAASRRMNIIVLFNGSGDLASGQSAADTFAQVDTFCQGRRRVGFKVVVATILSRGDLAAASQRAYEAARQDYNTLLRTNGTRVADALADVAADATLGMASVTANRTYYQGDEANPTAAGHRIIAGIVAAAIRTL